MRTDVCSGTSAGSHVLFDPTLAPDVHVDRFDPGAALDAAVEAGHALVLDTGDEDEGLVYAVFVGEPLPPDLAAASTPRATDVLLRAPSGRLLAAGVEAFVDEEERDGTTVELAPGDQLVDVFETRFGEAELQAALLADPATAADFRRERWAGPVGGLLLIGGVIGCFVGLALGVGAGGGVGAWGSPDPATTAKVLRAATVVGAGLLSFGLGAAWLRLLLPGEAYRRRRQAHAARFPRLALTVRPAPASHGARGARVDLNA